MGGYSAGMIVQSDDGASEYVSLIDSNTYDPNTSSNVGPYWAPYSGAASCNGMYAIDTGTANAYIIAVNPPLTANADGRRVAFKATVSNTGASTLNAGGGATNLRRNDGTAMVSGDILAGAIYDCIYDASSNTFIMTTPVISQYAPLYAPEVPTGTILSFASSVAPSGYLLCDGAAVSRTTYAALYSLVGNLYGSGDGSTTFNVPDLRGRVAMGAGQGAGLENRVLANTHGTETHTLSIAEMPSHTHGLQVITGSGAYDNGSYYGNYPGNTSAAGGGGAHNNIQPSLVLSAIIKT
jgi:microcystin-dependent protein